MRSLLPCFKAYDIRGRVPDVLNSRAVVDVLGAKRVVLGRDARLSGPLLRDALANGLCEGGASVANIGLCGTEEIYYAAANPAADGPFGAGIMITGSHNPADENGFKLVRGGAIPVSGDSGLFALRDRVAELLAGGAHPPRCGCSISCDARGFLSGRLCALAARLQRRGAAWHDSGTQAA